MGSALKQRVATALVLIPLVIAGVLLLPTVWFGILLALLLLLAGEEWSKLGGLSSCIQFMGFFGALTLGILGMVWPLYHGVGLLPLFLLATLWWCWNALRIVRIAEIRTPQGPDYHAFVNGLLVLIPAWSGLVWIHQLEHGPYLVLFLMVLIWIADSGAFFTGRRWGRIKLAPLVSPGKTREGAYGALAGGLLWGVLLAALYGDSPLQQAGLLLLCLVTVAASIVGDLYESLIKRERGVKDSGRLLPGHGGILDRIDSLTAAAPVFALGMLLLEMSS